MASSDALPVPRKNVAYRVTFPILDADGDLVSAATGLDSERSLDGATFADITAEATEIASGSGMYFLDLTAAEMNADTVAIIVKTSTGGAKTTPIVLYPEEAGDIRVNVTEFLDAAPNAMVSGRIDTIPGAMAAGVLTAAAIAANAIEAGKINAGALDGKGDWNIGKTGYTAGPTAASIVAASFAAGAIDANAIAANAIGASEIADGAITAGTFAAGAIDAAAIATGAIDADAIAADAVTKLRSIVASTTTGIGSTTTFVDTARSEIIDTWNGQWVLFTSGTETNKIRLIVDFNAASDTATFAPPVSASVAASVTYEILPAAAVDVQSWLATLTGHIAPSALISGRVDASVGAMEASVLNAAAIATAAIDADAFAANAITAAKINAGALNGKGDWNIGKTGYSLSQSFPTNFADLSIVVSTGLVDITQTAADKVWGTTTRVLTAFSTGLAVSVWDVLESAIATGSSIGLKLKTNLDVVLSTRASPADVNTQVDDVLNVDTFSEPGQEAPPVSTTLQRKISYIYKFLRNRVTTTATTITVFADDATTEDHVSTHSDDDTTYDRGEFVSGV